MLSDASVANGSYSHSFQCPFLPGSYGWYTIHFYRPALLQILPTLSPLKDPNLLPTIDESFDG